MDKISYKLPVFEGPMDLLLHLINKHKLNIYDIPILELVEQYVAAVRQMQEDENLEVTSEFLEMAARLVYLKTVSLAAGSRRGGSVEKRADRRVAGVSGLPAHGTEAGGAYRWI